MQGPESGSSSTSSPPGLVRRRYAVSCSSPRPRGDLETRMDDSAYFPLDENHLE